MGHCRVVEISESNTQHESPLDRQTYWIYCHQCHLWLHSYSILPCVTWYYLRIQVRYTIESHVEIWTRTCRNWGGSCIEPLKPLRINNVWVWEATLPMHTPNILVPSIWPWRKESLILDAHLMIKRVSHAKEMVPSPNGRAKTSGHKCEMTMRKLLPDAKGKYCVDSRGWHCGRKTFFQRWLQLFMDFLFRF